MTRIFGDDNSFAFGNGYEPERGEIKQRMSHMGYGPGSSFQAVGENLPWPHVFGFSMHIMAQSSTENLGWARGNVYIPAGYTKDWAPFDDGAWFYDSNTDTTILIFHIDPKKVGGNIGRNRRNASGSVLIGQMDTGQPGYIHSHFEIFNGRGVPSVSKKAEPDKVKRYNKYQALREKKRIFFPSVFCPKR
jgi:hypothetical protein